MIQVIRWAILVVAFIFATLAYAISKELIPPSGLAGFIRGAVIFGFLSFVWNMTKKIRVKKCSENSTTKSIILHLSHHIFSRPCIRVDSKTKISAE